MILCTTAEKAAITTITVDGKLSHDCLEAVETARIHAISKATPVLLGANAPISASDVGACLISHAGRDLEGTSADTLAVDKAPPFSDMRAMTSKHSCPCVSGNSLAFSMIEAATNRGRFGLATRKEF
jgi:hypothetical protein